MSANATKAGPERVLLPRRSERATPREHLAVLDRRLEFLRNRTGERRSGEGYDRAERAALEWALGVARERLAETTQREEATK
jgi:hypothetical protein